MPACPTCADSFDTDLGVKQHHAKVHNESLRDYVTVECEYCGTEEEMFPSEAELFRYCSRECHAEAAKHDRLELICEHCGDDYEKLPNDPNRDRFCSIECHREWQQLENHPRYIEDEDMIAELLRFNKELGRPPSRNEMEKQGAYSAKPYYNHFGSWLDAIRAAGLEPRMNQTKEPLPEARYGKNWDDRRLEILRRDFFMCQDCGVINREHLKRRGRGLHVHHKIHAGRFEVMENAHVGMNLVTLCIRCHAKRHAEERLVQFT